MATSLLVLLDDIASLLDDIAGMTKVAAGKTAGVLGDDLALNAQQVAGVRAERELPVVWAVARGSLVNKAVLVPLALAISALAPWAVTPLLMAGGAYLCLEGVEKVAHGLWPAPAPPRLAPDPGRPRAEPEPAAAVPATLVSALADPAFDLVAFERDKIRGAVRTDFVLSAEIITITLGTVTSQPLATQFAVLAGIALIMTAGVYGLVAGIVKLDDAGLWLARRAGALPRAFGAALLRAAPWLMKGLSLAGTAAMFLVGGGILVHALPALQGAVHAMTAGLGAGLGGALGLLANALIGVAAGALVLVGLRSVQRLARRLRA